MKEIYVDGSGKGGIGIVVVEDGKITSLTSKRLYAANYGNISTLSEYTAVLEGLKLAEEGDCILTDQTSIIDNLCMYGELNVAYKINNDKSREVFTKLKHKINEVLSTKSGVTLYDVVGHSGDRYHNTSDKLALGKAYLLRRITKSTRITVEKGSLNLNKLLKGVGL